FVLPAASRFSPSRRGRTWPTSPCAASMRSTSAPAERATRTPPTSGSRSRSSSGRTQRFGATWPPDPQQPKQSSGESPLTMVYLSVTDRQASVGGSRVEFREHEDRYCEQQQSRPSHQCPPHFLAGGLDPTRTMPRCGYRLIVA